MKAQKIQIPLDMYNNWGNANSKESKSLAFWFIRKLKSTVDGSISNVLKNTLEWLWGLIRC